MISSPVDLDENTSGEGVLQWKRNFELRGWFVAILCMLRPSLGRDMEHCPSIASRDIISHDIHNP